MKRIIIDSQSSRLFVGVPMEQDYDQRGGLCEVGKGDLIVTLNPIDEIYLKYWSEDLGFTLPCNIIAGPFDKRYTLSEQIVRKSQINKMIKSFVGNSEARLEFFCIEKTEKELSQRLDIPAYCNFDFSIEYAKKIRFKKLCEEINIITAPWFYSDSYEKMIERIFKMIDANIPMLLKVDDGTGGISCGGILKITEKKDLNYDLINLWRNKGISFFIEYIIPNIHCEVSLHWEITENGDIKGIRMFNQLSENFSYAGVSYPLNLGKSEELIKNQLLKKLGPYMIEKGAKGFFCCDILVDYKGVPYWTDFNPRKGAIIYVWNFVRRLSRMHFSCDDNIYFWHKHFSFKSSKGLTFEKIRNILNDLLIPNKDNPFVVVTNPGIIPYGYIDLTGISLKTKESAKKVFFEAKHKLCV